MHMQYFAHLITAYGDAFQKFLLQNRISLACSDMGYGGTAAAAAGSAPGSAQNEMRYLPIYGVVVGGLQSADGSLQRPDLALPFRSR